MNYIQAIIFKREGMKSLVCGMVCMVGMMVGNEGCVDSNELELDV